MTERNTVLRSINDAEGLRCVDIFERPDGSFGFDEFRRDAERPGWYSIAYQGERRFESAEDALAAALRATPWLRELDLS